MEDKVVYSTEKIKDTENKEYKDSTYELVSTVAYLIGVPKRIFEADHEPPKYEVFTRLEKDRNARIIRHLSIIRTAIERNFKYINDKFKYEYATILSLPEYIPTESLVSLKEDGVNFGTRRVVLLVQHIFELNKLISDRINNCKSHFPLWVKWDYIRDLFIMPNGNTEEGTKAAAESYYENKNRYPYKMYINWKAENDGNILFNDKKFVKLLYSRNGDYFTDYDKVSDAGSYVKGSIYEFIGESEKVVVVVDCENSDPYKLAATFVNLNYEYTKKISSIILFDDVHTADAWDVLNEYTKIPVEHVMTERVKQNKSLVDIKLTARACLEHYKNHVDSFIIVSSDSDYWGLITSLSEARFLVMIERENTSNDLKKALVDAGIFYCYIDDFYTGNTQEIKMNSLYSEMNKYIDSHVDLNLWDMLESALKSARIFMPDDEKRQFYNKYVKSLKINVDEKGNVNFELKRKQY
ncbi:MAG: NYN domain-containing protein [Clostridia bacterium]|nr:NYN domain-containing protein [Clostridia bacterium]